MASITKRGAYWRVQVRRKGYPPQAHTFDTKSKAEALISTDIPVTTIRALKERVKGRILLREEAAKGFDGDASAPDLPEPSSDD